MATRYSFYRSLERVHRVGQVLQYHILDHFANALASLFRLCILNYEISRKHVGITNYALIFQTFP